MNDMASVIVPKSDQLNSDSLISGPITITVRDVAIRPGTEQPVSIFFDGDDGNPWKPCKSMSRVMVAVWGPDAKVYVGRSLTLYRDPSVKWGGMEVGGIRISHMSQMDGSMTMALTATKGSRKPYTVHPLQIERTGQITIDSAKNAMANATTLDELRIAWSNKAMAPFRDTLAGYLDQRKAELTPPEQGRTDEQHGDQFDDTKSDQPPATSSASQQEDEAANAVGSQEEADAGAASDTEDETPVYQAMIDGWKARLDVPHTVTDISSIRSEFDKNAWGLPDEVKAEIDGLLTEAAYKFTTGE